MAISTNGTVLTRLAGALYNTQMSYATYNEVASFDPSSLANALYTRDFGSSTDATVATTLVTNLGLTGVAGLSNWVAAQLTAAGSAKGAKIVDLLNGFAQLSSDATYGTAATTFNTKVETALTLSQTDGNKGGTFVAVGTVVSDEDTAYTLTTSDDEVTAGDGDDTFTGTTSTYEATDVLDGGDGADTLTVKLNASIAAELANIETINAEFRGTSADLDLENAEDVTSISVTGSSSGSISNMDIASEVTLTSFEDTLTINLIDDGASDDALSLTLDTVGDTSATTAVNAIVDLTSEIEAIEIATTTAASYVTIDDSESTLESAEITGAQALTIAFTSTGTDFATVDASAATGAVKLTLSTTSDVTVTGGSGADTIALGTTLTSDDAIDGGAGSDTLTFSMSTGTIAPTVENVENLTIVLADTTPGILSAANIEDAVAYSVSATSGSTPFTVKNVVDGSSFTFTDEDVINVNIDAEADAAVTLTYNDTTDPYLAGTITVSDATSVTLVSSGDGGNTAGAVALADAETVSVTALDDADFTQTGDFDAENAVDVTLKTTSDGALSLGASNQFLDDAEFLETLTITAAGDDSSDITITALGGATPAASLQTITITASSKADVTFGVIDAEGADLDSITITAASGSAIVDGVITAASVAEIVLSGAGSFTLDAAHAITTLGTIDATGVTGSLTLNLEASGGSGGADISTGTGTNNITLSAGDDTVLLSYDDDGYYGTDTITLNDNDTTDVEITGFEVGSGGDIIELDLSGMIDDGSYTVIEADNDGDDSAGSDTIVFYTIDGVADLDDISTDANILVIDGDIDSTSDLETQLSINGDFQLTLGDAGAMADDDAFLVLWDDGTDTYLSLVANTSGSAISAGDTLTTSELTVTTILTLVGIADATTVNVANLGTALNA
jgi:hypothetical protein